MHNITLQVTHYLHVKYRIQRAANLTPRLPAVPGAAPDYLQNPTNQSHLPTLRAHASLLELYSSKSYQ